MQKVYRFYHNDDCDIKPINPLFSSIKNPKHLYDLLGDIWCEYSCAPRLRKDWSINNKTLGQCSITAFLAQDIFGGEVWGIKLDDGSYHCFNIVGKTLFDLASEQFGDVVLDYENRVIQNREEHFSTKEKEERYLYLRDKLLKGLKNEKS